MGKIYMKTGNGTKRKLSLSSLLSYLCVAMMSLLGYGCSTEPDEPDNPDNPDDDRIVLMYGTVSSTYEIKSMAADDPSLEPDSLMVKAEDNN